MKFASVLFFATAITICCVSTGFAQLEITEFLYDSRSAEPAWEWIELRNSGAVDVDLDGYILDDRSTAAGQFEPNIVSLVGDASVNTTVPAGGVAVLYNGAALDFDETRFRRAWEIGNSVPLVGVDGWQSLNNGGDAFGLWSSLESYQADLDNVDEDDDLEVAGFSNAAVWIDYDVDGFPGSGGGNSLQWNGTGSFQSGENWSVSTEDTSSLSVATSLEGLAINDANDIGNLGIVIGDVDNANSLIFTEIMYNPASDEPEWEWIELYNGSDQVIDFSDTAHFLDDTSGADLAAPNVNDGTVGIGETAILFPSSNTVENMEAAWGDANYISVESWPGLNNGGDLVAIWNDEDEYLSDSENGDRIADGATFGVTYDDGDNEWPNVGQGNSISILDASDDPNDGLNWILSADGDGDSVFANGVIASQPDHNGGDLGTPGQFGSVQPTLGLDLNNSGAVDAEDALLVCGAAAGQSVSDFIVANGGVPGDFDLNGEVDFADFLNLSSNFGSSDGVHYGLGDADCEGDIGFADFLVLSSSFGRTTGNTLASVPEPNGWFLAMASTLLLMDWRQRRV